MSTFFFFVTPRRAEVGVPRPPALGLFFFGFVAATRSEAWDIKYVTSFYSTTTTTTMSKKKKTTAAGDDAATGTSTLPQPPANATPQPPKPGVKQADTQPSSSLAISRNKYAGRCLQ